MLPPRAFVGGATTSAGVLEGVLGAVEETVLFLPEDRAMELRALEDAREEDADLDDEEL